MQLVYESALVILTTDYTLLGSQHSRAEHTGSWSGVLRRSVRKVCEAGQSPNQITTGRCLLERIERLVLIVARMEQ